MCEKKKLQRMGDGHPLDMSKMTKEELDAKIAKGIDSVRNGRGLTADEVDNMLKNDFEI